MLYAEGLGVLRVGRTCARGAHVSCVDCLQSSFGLFPCCGWSRVCLLGRLVAVGRCLPVVYAVCARLHAPLYDNQCVMLLHSQLAGPPIL